MKASVALFLAITTAFSCCAVAQEYTLRVEQGSPVAEDFPYRIALFYFQTGAYEPGLEVLASAKPSSVAVNAYRNMLAGNINLALKRYSDVLRYLNPLNDPQFFSDYGGQVLLPLAKAQYAYKRCDNVLQILNRAQSFASEIAAQAMYLQVSCVVGQNADAAAMQQAEQLIIKTLETRNESDNMWFAYAYYNLASAFSRSQNYIEANRLFSEVLNFTDKTSEGMALKERSDLHRGFANYSDNRFDFAAKAFADLPADSIWADLALLGYGWSSLNNYKSDMAIEAWRQLINLPYRSDSVYEGFMAIPSAYEKAGSYSDALSAYEQAISEFSKVSVEISALLKDLDLQAVHEHALQYSLGVEHSVKTVPSLLVRLYTEDELRGYVEKIDDIEKYKQLLSKYENKITKMKEVGDYSEVELNKVNSNVGVLRAESDQLQKNIEKVLLEKTLLILNQQKRRIEKYTLDARVAGLRLQEEFFLRGGRQL